MVLHFFGFFSSDEYQNSVVCKLYMKATLTKSGNTTNLFDQLGHFHRFEITTLPVTSISISATYASKPQEKTQRWASIKKILLT